MAGTAISMRSSIVNGPNTIASTGLSGGSSTGQLAGRRPRFIAKSPQPVRKSSKSVQPDMVNTPLPDPSTTAESVLLPLPLRVPSRVGLMTRREMSESLIWWALSRMRDRQLTGLRE